MVILYISNLSVSMMIDLLETKKSDGYGKSPIEDWVKTLP
jgi:hypothetical protein